MAAADEDQRIRAAEHSSSINQRMDNPRDGDTMEFWTAHSQPLQNSRQLDRWQPGYSLGLANTFATFVKA